MMMKKFALESRFSHGEREWKAWASRTQPWLRARTLVWKLPVAFSSGQLWTTFSGRIVPQESRESSTRLAFCDSLHSSRLLSHQRGFSWLLWAVWPIGASVCCWECFPARWTRAEKFQWSRGLGKVTKRCWCSTLAGWVESFPGLKIRRRKSLINLNFREDFTGLTDAEIFLTNLTSLRSQS